MKCQATRMEDLRRRRERRLAIILTPVALGGVWVFAWGIAGLMGAAA